MTADDHVTPSRRAARRQRLVGAVAGASVLLSAGGLVAAHWVKSPAQAAAEAAPPSASLITAKVVRQRLASTLVLRGTVGTGSRIEVTPAVPAGATVAVVSAVRVRPGQAIQPGQVLLEVSGRPLIALRGAVPAYRDLKPGDTGGDVRQLQAALAALGYFRGAPDGRFDTATKQAVSRLYAATGYDVPTTGDRDSLGAANDAVVAAQRAVASMRRRIAAGEKTPAGSEPLTVQLGYLLRDLAKTQTNEAYLVAHTGPRLPAAEVAFVPRFPARVEALRARVGAAVSAPLVTLATGDLVVTEHVDPDQAQLLATGMPARIDSEMLGGSATGTVTRVDQVTVEPTAGPSADPADGGTPAGTPYVPVTVTPAKPLPAAWNGQDVRVTVTAAKTGDAVLAVPVAAVTTRTDGRSAVTVVRPDGTTSRVTVRAGVSAGGYVEVTPQDGALAAGDLVSVGT